VTGKGPVKGNSRTLSFSVTFIREKQACILAVLGMSRISAKPVNCPSGTNPALKASKHAKQAALEVL
jgi:hypothetical protein